MVKATRLGEKGFWAAVTRCLSAFFGYEEAKARSLVEDYRARVLALAPDSYALAMHQEPFLLAGTLAGKELDYSDKFAETYRRVLDEAESVDLTPESSA